MSTGDSRRPSKSAAGKSTPAKSGKLLDRPADKPSAAKAGGSRGRRPVTPVKVSQGTNWGPILMFGGAALLAVLIIAFAGFQVFRQANQPTWQERAAAIPEVVNYWDTNADWLTQREHVTGVLDYPVSPPAGGNHNGAWQNCMGDVYTSEVAKEHAVHSMEHGAVWVTYRPDLPPDQVETLAAKVRERAYVLMSPFPGLDRPISLQAWGYQLKVDDANDDRIDEFIGALAQNASMEPGAACSGGVTEATGTPLDLGDQMQ